MAFPDKNEQLRILKIFLEYYPDPIPNNHPFSKEGNNPDTRKEIAYLVDSKLLQIKKIAGGKAQYMTLTPRGVDLASKET